MNQSSKLSRMLHVLLHMARHNGTFTSEQIAKMLQTNPVVVRRTMTGLREAGYVQSERGRNGGWKIVCDLRKTTLLDIHRAVGDSQIFAISPGDVHAVCAVERLVGQALSTTLESAGAIVYKRLASVTLADLAADFDRICRDAGWDEKRP